MAWLFGAASLTAAEAGSTNPAPGELLLVHAGTLIAVPGQPPRMRQTLLVRDGRILDVRSGFVSAEQAGEPAARVIDLSDQYVLPGLIDLHVHLTTEVQSGGALRSVTQSSADLALVARRHAAETLAAGFTTVLDMGTGRAIDTEALRAVRSEIRAGRVAGPRMLLVGSPISATGGSRTGRYASAVQAALGPLSTCDGADECRRVVREQVAAGADAINFYNTGSLNDVDLADVSMTDAEMKAIVDTAHELGRKVIADGHKAAGVNAALRAGADIIDTAPWPDEETWRLFQSGASLEPHLHAFVIAGQLTSGSSGQNPPAPADARVRDVLSRPFAAQTAAAKDVRLAYGSDTGIVQHGDNAGDLEEWVRLGMTPARALKIATIDSAASIGLSQEVGSLTPGKSADLIATREDPLKDIRAVRRLSTVMQAGRLLRHEPATTPSKVLVIWAGRLWVGPEGAPRSKQSLVIRNGRIEKIVDGFLAAESFATDQAVQVVDCSTQFVLPGLFDLHVHLSTEPAPGGDLDEVTSSDADLALRVARNAHKTVRAGFTTVIDMGTGRRAHEQAVYAVRDAIRAGRLAGPDILAVGSPISTPGNSRMSKFRAEVDKVIGPQGVCSGADDCRRAVREQVARGADVINFYNTGSLLSPTSPAQTMTAEEMRAIVEAAHALHRKAIADGAGKPSSAAGINAALDAGADWVDTGIYPDAGTWQRLRSSGRSYVPHLYAMTAAVGDSPTTLTTGSMGWLPEPVLQTLYSLKRETPAAVQALRLKVPMALASDAGVFEHGRNAGELIEYVKLGMTPAQALTAGTWNAARVLGLEADRGSLAVGKRADLIAVDGDPLSSISDILNVRTVVAGGRVVPQ